MDRSRSTASAEPTRPPWGRLGGVFVAGGAAGAAIALALLPQRGPQEATSTAFALGALIFGAALLGWTAAVVGGRGLETTYESVETESQFTEAGARRAMLLLCALGLGGMVGASVISAVLT
ncbi:DUF7268 family protein [Salinilacihabitans rarus]|uniref:DUF7268 family protein n=1 Tax=Salinilacihabitans rarus TaxID=2961596 RepID=UPI0020C83B48|nr:hypothetical protein [Salinilacihabitans rarus]